MQFCLRRMCLSTKHEHPEKDLQLSNKGSQIHGRLTADMPGGVSGIGINVSSLETKGNKTLPGRRVR